MTATARYGRDMALEVRSSTARLAAVQALYEIDLSGASADPILREFMETRWSKVSTLTAERGKNAGKLADPDTPLLYKIVRGVAERERELDQVIALHLDKNWQVNRLEALLRAVLRAATFELLARSEAPARVIINEYVNVARAFFGGTEPALVNATLDALSREMRPQELSD